MPKVDDFIFLVVMFTFSAGNIPIQLGYDVFLVKSKGMPLFAQRNLGSFMCPTIYSPPFAKEVTLPDFIFPDAIRTDEIRNGRKSALQRSAEKRKKIGEMSEIC